MSSPRRNAPRQPLAAGMAAGLCLLPLAGWAAAGASALPQPKPIPRVQAVPLPDHQIAFRDGARELTRYRFAPGHERPFWFPVHDPDGHDLTRMGHPHDPDTHSHHNSFWIAHHDVAGVDFWGDQGKGRIRHRRVVRLEDGDEAAAALVENEWVEQPDRVLLREWRRMEVRPLADGEWLLVVDLWLTPVAELVLGQTPFGFTGVRMAKSIGVRDGGGRILNSAGGVDEAEVFWQPARWVDYRGASAPGTIAGLALLDHPANPNHPAVYHVRDDGWMGASFAFAAPVVLRPDSPLHLRYGLLAHRGAPGPGALEAQWRRFANLAPAPDPAR